MWGCYFSLEELRKKLLFVSCHVFCRSSRPRKKTQPTKVKWKFQRNCCSWKFKFSIHFSCWPFSERVLAFFSVVVSRRFSLSPGNRQWIWEKVGKECGGRVGNFEKISLLLWQSNLLSFRLSVMGFWDAKIANGTMIQFMRMRVIFTFFPRTRMFGVIIIKSAEHVGRIKVSARAQKVFHIKFSLLF